MMDGKRRRPTPATRRTRDSMAVTVIRRVVILGLSLRLLEEIKYP